MERRRFGQDQCLEVGQAFLVGQATVADLSAFEESRPFVDEAILVECPDRWLPIDTPFPWSTYE
jgi:hypothetical protein